MITFNYYFAPVYPSIKYKAQLLFSNEDYTTPVNITNVEFVENITMGKRCTLTLSAMTANNWHENMSCKIEGSTYMDGIYSIISVDYNNNQIDILVPSVVDISLADGTVKPYSIVNKLAVKEGTTLQNLTGQTVGYTYTTSEQFLVDGQINYIGINNIGTGDLTYSIKLGINGSQWNTTPIATGTVAAAETFVFSTPDKTGKSIYLVAIANSSGTTYYLEGI